MKKLFSLIVAFVIGLSLCVPAFADGDSYFNAISKMNGNYEAQMELTMSVDKPFEVLDVLGEFLEGELGNGQQFLGLPANLRTLVESVFDTTSKIDVKASVSKDYKKMAVEMSGSSTVPLKFGENLKNTTEMNQKMWMELDFSDINKPVYRMIQLNPLLGDKYVVMDMGEILGEEMKTFAGLMNIMLSNDGINLLKAKMTDSIKEHAKIAGKGSNIKLVFDDKATKRFLLDAFDAVSNLIKAFGGDKLSAAGLDADMLDVETIREIFTPVKDISIFGDEGIVYDITVKNGLVSTENVKFSIDLNLYDVICAFDPDAAAEGFFLDKENSNIAFSVSANCKYKSVNKDVAINFPTLTKENSVNLADSLVSAMPEPAENLEMYDFPQYYSVVAYGYPIELDGKDYIPVRDLFSAYGVADEDITWDNGTIYVKSNGACEYFDEISFVCGEAKAKLNGAEILLDDFIVNIKGKTCVSADFVEKVLGGKVTSVYFYRADYDWEEKYSEYTIEHEAEINVAA